MMNGAEDEPITEPYFWFSIAIMTIWLKLLPVGAANAVAGMERSIMPIERAAKSSARLLRSSL